MKVNKGTSIISLVIAASFSALVYLISEQPLNLNSNTEQLLMIHCSATPEGRIVTPEGIISYHTRPVAKGGMGWSRPGYRTLITLDAVCHDLWAYNNDTIIERSERTNGAGKWNRIAAHVCYVGGLDKTGKKAKNTLTHDQDSVLRAYVLAWLFFHPNGYVCGHNQFDRKSCPSFSVEVKAKEWGVPDRNILKGKRYE